MVALSETSQNSTATTKDVLFDFLAGRTVLLFVYSLDSTGTRLDADMRKSVSER